MLARATADQEARRKKSERIESELLEAAIGLFKGKDRQDTDYIDEDSGRDLQDADGEERGQG